MIKNKATLFFAIMSLTFAITTGILFVWAIKRTPVFISCPHPEDYVKRVFNNGFKQGVDCCLISLFEAPDCATNFFITLDDVKTGAYQIRQNAEVDQGALMLAKRGGK